MKEIGCRLWAVDCRRKRKKPVAKLSEPRAWSVEQGEIILNFEFLILN